MTNRESSTVFVHDSDGYFIGVDADYGGPTPHNSVPNTPDFMEGFIPRWTGDTWEQVENHKGREGFVNGMRFTVQNYGPLPEGWTEEFVDPRPSGEIRRVNIQTRLEEIARISVSPLRAIVRGKGTAADEKYLDQLEQEEKALLEELSSLS